MTAELERLKTTCLAQEAEIARLQAGFDELKNYASNWVKTKENSHFGGYSSAMNDVLNKINRITGVKE